MHLRNISKMITKTISIRVNIFANSPFLFGALIKSIIHGDLDNIFNASIYDIVVTGRLFEQFFYQQAHCCCIKDIYIVDIILLNRN